MRPKPKKWNTRFKNGARPRESTDCLFKHRLYEIFVEVLTDWRKLSPIPKTPCPPPSPAMRRVLLLELALLVSSGKVSSVVSTELSICRMITKALVTNDGYQPKPHLWSRFPEWVSKLVSKESGILGLIKYARCTLGTHVKGCFWLRTFWLAQHWLAPWLVPMQIPQVWVMADAPKRTSTTVDR